MENENISGISYHGKFYFDEEKGLSTLDKGKKVLNFSVIVDQKPSYNEDHEKVIKTDFERCTAWDNLAEHLYKKIKQQSLIRVEGKPQIKKKEDENGVMKYYKTLVVDTVATYEKGVWHEVVVNKSV